MMTSHNQINQHSDSNLVAPMMNLRYEKISSYYPYTLVIYHYGETPESIPSFNFKYLVSLARLHGAYHYRIYNNSGINLMSSAV